VPAAWTVETFVVASALAAGSDVAHRRIPNWLTVPLLAGGIGAHAVAGVAPLGSALGAALLVFGALLPAWLGRALGGGDLKFAVAAAAWVGLARLPSFLLASALAGGLAAAAAWAASDRAARLAILGNLRAAARGVRIGVTAGATGGRVPVPAGAAFAAGAVWTLLGGAR
jgi:Flp pilus assembly protein protease CpaA